MHDFRIELIWAKVQAAITALGGWLVEQLGMDALMGYATGASALGMAVMFLAAKMPRKNGEAPSRLSGDQG